MFDVPHKEVYEYYRALARGAYSKLFQDRYNNEARDYIFEVNNVNCAEDEIDLHGLLVNEAKEILRNRINMEMKRGSSGIHV